MGEAEARLKSSHSEVETLMSRAPADGLKGIRLRAEVTAAREAQLAFQGELAISRAAEHQLNHELEEVSVRAAKLRLELQRLGKAGSRGAYAPTEVDEKPSPAASAAGVPNGSSGLRPSV